MTFETRFLEEDALFQLQSVLQTYEHFRPKENLVHSFEIIFSWIKNIHQQAYLEQVCETLKEKLPELSNNKCQAYIQTKSLEDQIQEQETKITRLISVKNAAETNLKLMENLKQSENDNEQIKKIIESCKRVDEIAQSSLSARTKETITHSSDFKQNENNNSKNSQSNLATHLLVDALAAQHGGINNQLQNKIKTILSQPHNQGNQNALDDTIQENSILLDSVEQNQDKRSTQQVLQEQQRAKMLNTVQIQQLDKNEEPLEITTTFIQAKEEASQANNFFQEESTKTNLQNKKEQSSSKISKEKKPKEKACCSIF